MTIPTWRVEKSKPKVFKACIGCTNYLFKNQLFNVFQNADVMPELTLKLVANKVWRGKLNGTS